MSSRTQPQTPAPPHPPRPRSPRAARALLALVVITPVAAVASVGSLLAGVHVAGVVLGAVGVVTGGLAQYFTDSTRQRWLIVVFWVLAALGMYFSVMYRGFLVDSHPQGIINGLIE